MFKNQLQELAQRSCFNLPSYTCIREGPDHAPRFKASVNFNGEIFDSPTYCTTLRQAEHAAAEVALNALSTSGPSRSLTARVLDETGVYKNLLQETAHRAGLNLPVYTTVRSGPGHLPVFTSTVELAGMSFVGESAKTKKQAEKNAAIAAWSALKTLPNLNSLSPASKESDNSEGRGQMTVARALSTGPKDETRVIRKRYQNQSRRRLVSSSRDNGSSNKDTEQQQWRFMDLFVDFTKEGFSTQRPNWFASLLPPPPPPPPPPPRTTSKILPPTCPSPPDLSKTKPISLETRGNSQGKMQEMRPPLDDHQRRQEEWLNQEKDGPSRSTSSAIDKANPVRKPISQSTSGKHNISILDHNAENKTRVNVPRAPPITLPLIKVSPRCSAVELGMSSYGGGYAYHPQRIAPAVQIRSVIPVCAAPPAPPMRSSSSDPAAVKEVILRRAPSSLPTQTGPEASLTGLRSRTTELSSTFSKLRL